MAAEACSSAWDRAAIVHRARLCRPEDAVSRWHELAGCNPPKASPGRRKTMPLHLASSICCDTLVALAMRVIRIMDRAQPAAPKVRGLAAGRYLKNRWRTRRPFTAAELGGGRHLTTRPDADGPSRQREAPRPDPAPTTTSAMRGGARVPDGGKGQTHSTC